MQQRPTRRLFLGRRRGGGRPLVYSIIAALAQCSSACVHVYSHAGTDRRRICLRSIAEEKRRPLRAVVWWPEDALQNSDLSAVAFRRGVVEPNSCGEEEEEQVRSHAGGLGVSLSFSSYRHWLVPAGESAYGVTWRRKAGMAWQGQARRIHSVVATGQGLAPNRCEPSIFHEQYNIGYNITLTSCGVRFVHDRVGLA